MYKKMAKTVKRTIRNKSLKKTNKRSGGGRLGSGDGSGVIYNSWNPADWKDCKNRLATWRWDDYISTPNPFTADGDEKYYERNKNKDKNFINIGVDYGTSSRSPTTNERQKANVCYNMFDFKNKFIQQKRRENPDYKYTKSEDVLREAVEDAKIDRRTPEQIEADNERAEHDEAVRGAWDDYDGGRKRKTLKTRSKNKRSKNKRSKNRKKKYSRKNKKGGNDENDDTYGLKKGFFESKDAFMERVFDEEHRRDMEKLRAEQAKRQEEYRLYNQAKR